ncbi:hypothetical protein Emag_003124 [Eimeria magna]
MAGHRLCGGHALASFGRPTILLQSHHQVPLQNSSHRSTCSEIVKGSTHPRDVCRNLRYGEATRVARILGFARLHSSTSLVAEGQPAEKGCSKTPEEAALAALVAAQEAAVRSVKSAADTTLSQAWKAVVEVEHLLEAQRHLIRRAKRLQRSRAFFHVACDTQPLAKTALTAPSVQLVTDAACCLPSPVVAFFRELANGVAAQGVNLHTQQLLLLCEKLERMDCCTSSLKAAVLQRLIVRSSSLQPYEVALGLQVVALLMKPSEPREVLGVYGLRMEGAAATRDNHTDIQQMCLAAATQLLGILAHNKVFRRKLSVRMLVRTAEACRLLSRQAHSEPELQGSPAMFAAAVAAAASLGALQDSESGSIAASSNVGGGNSCRDHFVRVSAAHEDRLSLTACDRATMGSASCRLIKGAVESAAEKACAVPGGKVASQLIMAAWARRMRLSLAPRAAAVLLEEACARQQHEQGAAAHIDPAWGVESVRTAMTTATSKFLTQPTRLRLLKKLLLRLRQLHHRPLDLREGRHVRAREDSETEGPYEEMMGSDSEAPTSRVNPVALASICHSLAISCVTFSSPQLHSVFRLIQASFSVDDGGVASARGPRDQRLLEQPSCSLANAVHVIHQDFPQKVPGSGSSDTRDSTSGLPSRLQYPCDVAAFYGEWATVLWAGARLLKTVASSSPQDPVLFEGRLLLVGQLLPHLIERLCVAEPRNVGQIADALRLLLLVDAKTHGLTHESCMPLLLQQRLQPADKLLATVQALGRHLVQYIQAFGAVELLECLRLFLQLDLLHCLDAELEAKAFEVSSGAAAQKQIVMRGRLPLCATKHSEAMTVSAAGVLRSALPRLLTLTDPEYIDPRATFSFEGQSLQQNPKPQDTPLCGVYARSLLRSLMLKYPGEVLRLPKAIRQGVMRQCKDLKFVDPVES